MLKKCRNDVLKYGYDSRKNDSVMACFVRGGRKSAPPCSFHTVLQAAAYWVKGTSLILISRTSIDHTHYHIYFLKIYVTYEKSCLSKHDD